MPTLESVWHALPALARRLAANQDLLFSAYQNDVQRQLAVASSVSSVVLCTLALYCLLAIDPRRLVFRHHLIGILLVFDFAKAVVLLIFPGRVLSNPLSYSSNDFCQVVGFFTATSIEGADLAILAFAIHTFLLIFKPGLTVKIPNSDRVEGGLYRFRYYIYVGAFIVIPLALASFPYIGNGYHSYVCWCYLPQRPYWYRAALSWAPRYAIIITILVVYVLIYVHVVKEFHTLGGAFSTFHRQRAKTPRDKASKPSFFSAVVYFFLDVRGYLMPRMDVADGSKESTLSVDTNGIITKADDSGGPLDVENSVGNEQFHAANLENFRKRKKIIEKQMKSIFVYPFAYIFVWFFPFLLYCTQFTFEQTHGPVVWLNYLLAFMQPFIGFVDSMVFFYREQPMQHTVMKTYQRENAARLDDIIMRNVSSGDVDSEYTVTRLTKSSLATHAAVPQYARWRHLLSQWHFPLMRIPTEQYVAQFQQDYVLRKMKALRQQLPGTAATPGENDGPQAGHDFSNLLDGFGDADFRDTLQSYLMSRKASETLAPANGLRASVASNKLSRSRRPSVFDDLAIAENLEFSGGRPSVGGSRRLVPAPYGVPEETEMDFLDFLRKGPA